MKLRLLFMALATAGILASCNNAPKGDEATVDAEQEAAAKSGETMAVDVSQSEVTWTGTKPVGAHYGTFKLTSGEVSTENGMVTGGEFVIDINSMVITDEDADSYRENLRGHLVSEDFFKAETHPTAKFVITKVEPISEAMKSSSKVENANYVVSGNLTLRDTTNNITFPANINVTDNMVSAKANFDINRTWWKMHYGNDSSLGDKFIRPEVNVGLNLVAKK